MQQTTITRCEEYYRRIGAGESGEKARKELGLGTGTLFNYRAFLKKQKPKNKDKKPKAHKFIELVSPSEATKVAVIVCSLDNIKSVIAGLQ